MTVERLFPKTKAQRAHILRELKKDGTWTGPTRTSEGTQYRCLATQRILIIHKLPSA